MCDTKSENTCFHKDIDGLQAVHSLSVSTALQGKKKHWLLLVSKLFTRPLTGPYCQKVT